MLVGDPAKESVQAPDAPVPDVLLPERNEDLVEAAGRDHDLRPGCIEFGHEALDLRPGQAGQDLGRQEDRAVGGPDRLTSSDHSRSADLADPLRTDPGRAAGQESVRGELLVLEFRRRGSDQSRG